MSNKVGEKMDRGPVWQKKWTNQWSKWLKIQQITPKKLIGCTLLVLIGAGALTFTVLISQPIIRDQQIRTLVEPENTSTKVEMIPYGTLAQFVHDKPAVSILFGAPTVKTTQEAFLLLTKKEHEMNRKIYWYPIVYDQDQIAKTYALSAQELTFVFFQNGVEKKRVLYTSLADPENELIPEVNRLPMWNITDQKKH